MIKWKSCEKAVMSPAGVTWLLRRVNLQVKEGEFVTIMGPSGAGKTTLLSILGLLDDGWAGEFMLFAHPVHKLGRRKRAERNRQHVGFVFQSYHLLDTLTLQEKIAVPRSYRHIPPAHRARMLAEISERLHVV